MGTSAQHIYDFISHIMFTFIVAVHNTNNPENSLFLI